MSLVFWILWSSWNCGFILSNLKYVYYLFKCFCALCFFSEFLLWLMRLVSISSPVWVQGYYPLIHLGDSFSGLDLNLYICTDQYSAEDLNKIFCRSLSGSLYADLPSLIICLGKTVHFLFHRPLRFIFSIVGDPQAPSGELCDIDWNSAHKLRQSSLPSIVSYLSWIHCLMSIS